MASPRRNTGNGLAGRNERRLPMQLLRRAFHLLTNASPALSRSQPQHWDDPILAMKAYLAGLAT
jgi:hypothetical protein